MTLYFNIQVDEGKLSSFCKKWEVQELALFGSVLNTSFGAESDIDILVTFSPTVKWSLLDHVDMQDGLTEIFGRKVDLVTRKGIERSRNSIRRKEILTSARPIYAAAA